jgi:predicted nucleic acid-binding protein
VFIALPRRLLDANIISNVTKLAPSQKLAAWMAEQADEDLFISSMTISEIRAEFWRSPLERDARPPSFGRG